MSKQSTFVQDVDEQANRGSASLSAQMYASCSNCKERLQGEFCHNCGQKHIDHHDYSLKAFASHGLHEILHFDSKVFRTLVPLMFKPGYLTEEYFSGKRMRYLKPLQLFILINVLFFLVKTGGLFHYSLTAYLNEFGNLIQARINSSGLSEAVYEAKFNTSMHFQQKSYIILLVPVFAFVMKLLYLRAKRYYVEHLVFSLNFFAFLLVFLAVFPIPLIALKLLGVKVSVGERPLVAVIFIVCSIYLSIALKRVYKQKIPATLLKAFILAACVIPLILFYRIVLFFVVLHTT